MTLFAHHRFYWWRFFFFFLAVHSFSLLLYCQIERWRSLFSFSLPLTLNRKWEFVCIVCAGQRRETKNSLKSSFSRLLHTLTGCCRIGVRKRKKRRTEKCQSYDSEHMMIEREGRVMDIWTNILVVVAMVELCHFGRCVWSSSSFLVLFDPFQ
jgi:hypothetical protein